VTKIDTGSKFKMAAAVIINLVNRPITWLLLHVDRLVFVWTLSCITTTTTTSYRTIFYQCPVASKGTPGDAKCVTEIPGGQK